MAKPVIIMTTDFPNNTLFRPNGPAQAFTSAVESYMREIGEQGQNIAKAETPVGARGSLRDSVDFKRTGFLEGAIEWSAVHARPVADGSSPHFAPLAPLKEWATIKWGSPDAGQILQDHIAHRGTRGNKYPQRTQKRVLEIARRLWPQKITEYVRRLLT